MAINKVVYNGKTLIDLTNDTVGADLLQSGITAHKKDGTSISGSIPLSNAGETITDSNLFYTRGQMNYTYAENEKVNDKLSIGTSQSWYPFSYSDGITVTGNQLKLSSPITTVSAENAASGYPIGKYLLCNGNYYYIPSNSKAGTGQTTSGVYIYYKFLYKLSINSSAPTSGNNVLFKRPTTTKRIITSGYNLQADATLFGDATQENVTEGYYFTSENGIKMGGTLPKNPSTSYEFGSINSYKSTSGLCANVLGTWNPSNTQKIGSYSGSNDFSVLIPLSNFGNASVADVKNGVTFTSSTGLKVTGEYEETGSGSYLWKKYSGKKYTITKTDLGKTAPTDAIGFNYAKCPINNDYFLLQKSSTSTQLYTYSYIKGKTAETHPTSVYYKSWTYVYNGDSYYEYYLYEIPSSYTEEKGDFLQYISSDSSSKYPDDGMQDGYYYVKIATS